MEFLGNRTQSDMHIQKLPKSTPTMSVERELLPMERMSAVRVYPVGTVLKPKRPELCMNNRQTMDFGCAQNPYEPSVHIQSVGLIMQSVLQPVHSTAAQLLHELGLLRETQP